MSQARLICPQLSATCQSTLSPTPACPSSQAQQQGLAASFLLGQQGSGAAWGPLAAQQHRLRASTGGILRSRSSLDGALPPLPAASGADGSKRVSFSVPCSPQRSGMSSGSRAPPPLNLQAVAGRLQVQPVASRSLQHEQQARPQHQLSPVLEALLSSLPTPEPELHHHQQQAAAAGDLAADDLADISDDEEGEWRALESMQARQEGWQRQAAAEQAEQEGWQREQQQPEVTPAAARQHGQPQQQQQVDPWHREITPEWTSRDQLDGWFAAQQAAAAVEQQQAEAQWARQQAAQVQQVGGRYATEGRLAVQLPPGEPAAGAGAAPLPSPITFATADMDGTLARLLASAGNTPTGPLGHHRRTGEGGRDGEQEGVAWGVPGQLPPPLQARSRRHACPACSSPAASLGGSLPAGPQQVVLLEPMLPAPLGEGIRASERMAEGVSAAELRRSIEFQRSMLRPASAAASLRSSYADGLPTEAEAAAWVASQGGSHAAGGSSICSLGGASAAPADASTAAWHAAAVPPAAIAGSKRGLWAKLTSKPKLH